MFRVTADRIRDVSNEAELLLLSGDSKGRFQHTLPAHLSDQHRDIAGRDHFASFGRLVQSVQNPAAQILNNTLFDQVNPGDILQLSK
jgi:hypothetical protein